MTASVPTLRDALPSDRAFLLALYASTRAEEFAHLGWPVEMERAFMKMQFDAQRGDYERRHPRSLCQIVEMRGCPVGRLWVAQDARSLTVLDISLVAELRAQGIGTDCLRRVQRRAASARRCTRRRQSVPIPWPRSSVTSEMSSTVRLRASWATHRRPTGQRRCSTIWHSAPGWRRS